MTIGSLKPYYLDMTSEEQAILRDNHLGIPLHQGGVELNKEVFLYPLLFTFDFISVAWLLSSELRYLYSAVAWVLVFAIFGGMLGYAAKTFLGAMSGKSSWATKTLRTYYFLMTAGAFGFGFYTGENLWDNQSHPFYDYEYELKTYKGVNPAEQTTRQFGDAGAIYFVNDATLWRGRGACLKNDHSYCVMPIVQCGDFGDCANPKQPTTGKYEYFAVGKDCCGCPNGDFRCGAWANPLATSGLRNLDSKDRLYYKLAVQQWEGTYDLQAGSSPIFLNWDLWPAQTMYAMETTVTTTLVLGGTGFFCAQLIVAMIADRLGII